MKSRHRSPVALHTSDGVRGPKSQSLYIIHQNRGSRSDLFAQKAPKNLDLHLLCFGGLDGTNTTQVAQGASRPRRLRQHRRKCLTIGPCVA